jgi:hypothetical protein
VANETKTSLQRRTLLAAVAAVGLANAACAEATGPALVDLEIIDREAEQATQVWRHGGRLYTAGQPGSRYSLRVTNNTPGRVLVVMSVDGVNVLTGETAAYGQRGYVFGPYESYDVNGWRKSDSEVAAFTFAPLSRSYAARTGRPGDVGVIGVAAFTERVRAPIQVSPDIRSEARGQDRSYDAQEAPVAGRQYQPAPSAGSSRAAQAAPYADTVQRSERLGTGHGAREWSAVTTVPFERSTSYPRFVRRIEYDSYENLVASGVIPRYRPIPHRPQPFPSSRDRGGYAPDPPGGR